jgi:uncharacterized protein YjlB
MNKLYSVKYVKDAVGSMMDREWDRMPTTTEALEWHKYHSNAHLDMGVKRGGGRLHPYSVGVRAKLI